VSCHMKEKLAGPGSPSKDRVDVLSGLSIHLKMKRSQLKGKFPLFHHPSHYHYHQTKVTEGEEGEMGRRQGL